MLFEFDMFFIFQGISITNKNHAKRSFRKVMHQKTKNQKLLQFVHKKIFKELNQLLA